MYVVSSLRITVNGQPEWIPHYAKPIRRKAEAIAIADAQPIRATVYKAMTNIIVYDNGKPHGGKPDWVRDCPCPLCCD